ncbi:LysR family transcriptional regulator [Niveibacterium sp. SC-1]|uniref:LysR family transcriptional regulator n=1 Tax=Niveibacterium sp. SC-1 TaxID=3135646 RepID=UPI00311F9D95
MHPVHDLRRIDLNLLVVLDALLQERHVSRAAERLAMTQPAVSHALRRLRLLLDDPLLLRGGGGLRLSAKAQALQPQLVEALDRVRGLVSCERFDPATAKRQFHLGMSDHGVRMLLPRLVQTLRSLAPGIDLVVSQAARDTMLRQVLAGELDLVAGVFNDIPPGLRMRQLQADRFVCVADAVHAKDMPVLTLDRYLSRPHLMVSLGGPAYGVVDSWLASQGLQRRIATVVPHFTVAPELVRGTDLLLTLPRRVLQAVRTAGLSMWELPFALPPLEFLAIWNAERDMDEGHAWLRETLVRLVGEGTPEDADAPV